MRYLKLVTITSAAILAACGEAPGDSNSAATAAVPAVAAKLATEQTFRHAALDAALWIDTQEPAKSLLLVSGGEGGLEIDELSGRRAARFETVEAGFIDVRQNVASGSGAVDLVIASDQRQGAVRVYAFDAPARRIIELTGAPIEIDDAITGLCTFRSSITQKL